MANLHELIGVFEGNLRKMAARPEKEPVLPNVTIVRLDYDNPLVRHNEELNFATAPSQDPDGTIRKHISDLTTATLRAFPNRLERFRGQVPDEAIDGNFPLTDATYYCLLRLVGNDQEVLFELIQNNASAISDRHDLYWILAKRYRYDPNKMLEDLKQGRLKPL